MRIPDVERRGEPVMPDLGSGSLSRCQVDVGNVHGIPTIGEHPGQRPAQTAPGPGDNSPAGAGNRHREPRESWP